MLGALTAILIGLTLAFRHVIGRPLETLQTGGTLPPRAAAITFDDNPHLARQIGNDIITASGTTLLGADNKAGVAEIMAAVEYLLAHPEIAHGPLRIGFTPDEEVGNGTKHFDVERFGVAYAYTVDGETPGRLPATFASSSGSPAGSSPRSSTAGSRSGSSGWSRG